MPAAGLAACANVMQSLLPETRNPTTNQETVRGMAVRQFAAAYRASGVDKRRPCGRKRVESARAAVRETCPSIPPTPYLQTPPPLPVPGSPPHPLSPDPDTKSP